MHRDGVAGLRLAFDLGDATGKYPGMTALQRFLAAGFEDEFMHLKQTFYRQDAKSAKKGKFKSFNKYMIEKR
jgi:hypothetical protein